MVRIFFYIIGFIKSCNNSNLYKVLFFPLFEIFNNKNLRKIISMINFLICVFFIYPLL